MSAENDKNLDPAARFSDDPFFPSLGEGEKRHVRPARRPILMKDRRMSTELSKHYDPKALEQKWYDAWEEGGYEAGWFAALGLPATRWSEDIEARITGAVERIVEKLR